LIDKTFEHHGRVDVFATLLFCKKCGHEMQMTNISYPTNPPKHEHKCALCGEKTLETKKYPILQYKLRSPIKDKPK